MHRIMFPLYYDEHVFITVFYRDIRSVLGLTFTIENFYKCVWMMSCYIKPTDIHMRYWCSLQNILYRNLDLNHLYLYYRDIEYRGIFVNAISTVLRTICGAYITYNLNSISFKLNRMNYNPKLNYSLKSFSEMHEFWNWRKMLLIQSAINDFLFTRKISFLNVI